MDSLIESCDKRVNEILCGLMKSRHKRPRQDKWIFSDLVILVWTGCGGAFRIHFQYLWEFLRDIQNISGPENLHIIIHGHKQKLSIPRPNPY